MDKRVKHKEIPLTGKFMTADPAATGENFQTLTNLRPTDTHIKGVQGMTKINTTQLGSALDFTDATEVDIVADRISVAASKITVTSIYSDEEAYVYFDYGADYFSGDFRIDFQFNCTEQTVSVFGYAFIFGLSNAIDDLEGNRLAEGAEIVVLNMGELLSLSEQNGAVATKDSITALDLATEYYATIIRNESAGTYGTVSLHVYSDSTRETEIASSPATIELTEKQDFRYLYTFSSWNSGLADVAWSGTVEDYFIVYSKTKNAFHFSKAQPQESHVLAQVVGADGKTVLIQNETPIPDVGNFAATEVWPDGKNNPGEIPGLGRFSNAPDGQMMYCNGVDSLIWGGDEILPSAFITSTAVVADGGLITDPKDFTDNIRSTSKTAENILLLGGGVDDYTVLMLHCEGDDGGTVFTDSSDSAHTVTAVGDANTDLSQAKFGVSSGVFDGTGDYLTIPDSADWYFGTDPFTIDFWLRFNNLPSTSCGIFNQYDDADNTVRLSYDKTNTRVRLVVISGGSVVVSLESYKELFVDEWYHIELVRNGTSWVIYIGGVDRMVFGGTGAGAWPDLSGDIEIGRDTQDGIAYRYFDGWIDEVRFSKGIARNTEDFAPHSRPYMIARNNWLVGSIRPIQGIKYYIEGPNTVDSTVTGSYWNGKSWQTLDITDGTKPGTVSLAQTGFMTWSDTVGQARSVYLNGYFVNWYQFELSAGDATISHVTIDAEMQPILAHWDGVYRAALRFMERKAAYTDKTLNVLSEDYDADTPSTFFAVGGLSAFSDPDQCVEIGFAEKITAVWWTIAAKNTTAATTVAVDYWDGDAYLPIGTVVDGTEVGGISLAKSGAMSWFNSSIENETQKQVFSGPELYYYRFRWDTDLTAGARADYIGGITACETLHHYSFPIFAQGRVFLCDDITQARNSALVSGKYTPHVFIGSDSTRVYFGNDEPIKCGTELFSLFGSSLYSLVLMFKDTETWVMAGQEIGQWKNSIFQLSSSIGCPAPLTMKTVNLAANPGSGVNRSLVIWQGANGIYMSDGRSPIPIHEDINEYFDRSDTRCIKESKVGDSTGWIDPTRNEYHWKFASGATATDLNKELVYDIKRNKWFEIDRGTGKSLQCGVLVTDTDGNSYNYGFIDSGYMERLENGTDFDGADIDHTFQFGDMAFEGLAFATQIDRIKLLTVAKTVTDQDIICTHYGNTSIAGTAITMSPSNAGYRLAKPDFPEKLDGDPFHSLKFATSTDDEVIGFEPLAVVVTHHAIRED